MIYIERGFQVLNLHISIMDIEIKKKRIKIRIKRVPIVLADVGNHMNGAHREILQKLRSSKPNLDCNYPVPIFLTLIGIPFGAKSIGKL